MAKKRTPESDDNQRQSRKEVLIARRQARQTRQIRLAILAVILLIAVVIIAGVVNAAVVKPNQLVAIVANQEIKVSEWRDRVELQRAQLILSIEDLAESLGQDIGQVQQFAGQQLLLLTQDSERLGQIVLDQMIDEVLIQQAAEARGIFVSDEDVQKEIEESFSYFGGASPTALPTATETVIPTPSLTPIPTAVITEIVPTRTPFPTPTLGPTSTPFPTSTPVSQESFDEQLLDVVNRFEDLGISEEQFRNIVRSQLYQERLLERLAVEEELSEEAMHASLFYLEAASEDAANNLLEDINEEGFLEVWNAVKSEPFDPEAEDPIEANEILWRTQENISLILDEEVANVAFEQPLDSVSRVIVVPAGSEDEEDRYFLIMVSGREVRPLTETALSTARQELLESFLQVLRASEVETFERWRNNLPAGPTIDSRFLVAPTPTPFIPEEITPDAPEGEGE